jgi:putative tricarboxylic transport membrane protein
MMDFAGLAHGFAVLFSPGVLAACVLGLLAGAVAGFLPGLSLVGGLALQFAFLGLAFLIFGLESPAVFAVAFAYGMLYGRALAAINFNAIETGDAGPYPKRAAPALIAVPLIGIAAVIVVGLLVAPSSALKLSFGPAENAAFVLFLLLAGVAFSRGSVAGALAMVGLGLLLRTVGTDPETGVTRLTFGLDALSDGLGILDIALGLFVVANVIDDVVRAAASRVHATASDGPPAGLFPSIALAMLAGLFPTNGSLAATTAGAQRSRPRPGLFDPASQNSMPDIMRAALLSDIRLSVSLIPVLLLALPFDPVTVLLRNTIMGQAVISKELTTTVWLVCATMILAHVLPLIVVIYLARVRWRPIRLDARFVAPFLLALCCFVSWRLNDTSFGGIFVMLAFGAIGYGMIWAGLDRSVLFFAFAISGTLEENIRRSLLISRGDVTVFAERPIVAALIGAGLLLLFGVRLWRSVRH